MARNYAKIGNRKGLPAYRTPSSFRYKQCIKITRNKNPYGRTHKKTGGKN